MARTNPVSVLSGKIPDASFPNAVPHLPPTFCPFIPNAVFLFAAWDICHSGTFAADHLPFWDKCRFQPTHNKVVFLPLRLLPS